MRKSITVLLATSVVLAGCSGWSDSRTNPRNWFGNSRSTQVVLAQDPQAANPLIPQKSSMSKRPEKADASVLITSITELRVDRTPTGATILVTGIASRQGAYDVELHLEPADDTSPKGTLNFTFRVVYPNDPTPIGSDHTRTVREAYSLSNHDLQGVRLIRVQAEQNVRETRRR